jgi:Lrp/AsnC family transcriptional regulator for asnA, asnC and gidA
MDKIDVSILDFLQQDGRMPYTEIAQRLSISEGTVRNRVTRMIDEGVLRIVGMVDPVSYGLDAPAMIGITIRPAELEEAALAIASFPEVGLLVEVSGEYDLMVEVICPNREHLARFLNEQLSKVPGVVKTETFMVLRTFKLGRNTLPTHGLPSRTGKR